MAHKLIVTGAELTGKSYFIYDLWNTLEARYNKTGSVLDGCTWINTDVGLYGTDDGWVLVENMLNLAQSLESRNLIFEKFHYTQFIYENFKNKDRYQKINQALHDLNFRVVLTTVNPDESLISKRIEDRLRGNTSYQRIVKPPAWHIERQYEYRTVIQESGLPYIEIDNTQIPNENYKTVLEWIGEDPVKE